MNEPAVVEPQADPPAFRLYSAGQIAAASVFGTALCGAFMLSVNERRLGRRGSAVAVIIMGIAIEAGLIAVALMSAAPRTGGFHTILSVALYNAAKQRERHEFEAHIAAGGRRHSSWRVLANVMVNIVLILVAGGLYGVFGNLYGEKVEVASHPVYYLQPITADQARGVGEVLVEQGWFSDDNDSDAQVRTAGERVAVALAVQRDALDDEKLLATLHHIGERISSEVFDARPVEVRICVDDFDEVKKTLPPGPARKLVRLGKNRIYTMRAATEEDARKLEQALREVGYFSDDSAASVQLERGGDGFTIALLLKQGSEKDLEVAGLLKELKAAARRALGAPVQLNLCGAHWNVHTTVK